MRTRLPALLRLFLVLLLAAPAALHAQPPKKPEKPYREVVTKEASSDAGVFTVHRVGDRILYEIPPAELDREFLWVVQLARTRAGSGYGGTPVSSRVVRFEQRDERVLLRHVDYGVRAEVEDPIRLAVEASSVAPILASFKVATYGPDDAPVIDVTDVFLGDQPEFSARGAFGSPGADKERSFLESVKSFPANVETKVLVTYRSHGAESGTTALIHHSMVRLPETRMKPRRHDPRVGFFTVGFEDFGSTQHQVEQVRYVTRWRLEKRDPDAAVSEPVKPIVYYVGREVPARWRPWVKKGVESWQKAFEAAGFKNAILCKDAPTVEQDPDWDAEDARWSSIRWLPSGIENAFGPHVNDPRTGEILEADILMFHNVLKLLRDWYFVQAAACDPRAQKLPFPDDLEGELLAYVVAHEVGHTLGFPHNMKASASYTAAQLRDPEFTARFGTEASIMDYGRFNYVAQPGDGAALMPKVGPYDFFAVEWGYREAPREGGPAAEKAMLDALVARQADDPMLRFGDAAPWVDPSAQTEDLGSDPIEATALGLANVDRIASFLVEACCEENRDYELLRNMYGQLVNQRNQELHHVVAAVGGVVRTEVWYGQRERVFDAVPAERQRAAVAFLLEHGLSTPQALVAPAIVDRLEPNGAADRILGAQRSLLRELLAHHRVKRLAEQRHRDPQAYAPAHLLEDLRTGVFAELRADTLATDLYRRNLQRAFTETLIRAAASPGDSDLPALARGELRTLLDELTRSAAKPAERETRLHLEHLATQIDHALEPRSAQR